MRGAKHPSLSWRNAVLCVWKESWLLWGTQFSGLTCSWKGDWLCLQISWFGDCASCYSVFSEVALSHILRHKCEVSLFACSFHCSKTQGRCAKVYNWAFRAYILLLSWGRYLVLYKFRLVFFIFIRLDILYYTSSLEMSFVLTVSL